MENSATFLMYFTLRIVASDRPTLNKNKRMINKINLLNPDFMFELGLTEPKFNGYRQWNKLIKKIISI